MNSKTNRIPVVAGLIQREKSILITKRPADKHLGGYWEFPGGKQEPNETEPESLRRELKEELGLSVTVERLIHEVRHEYDDRTIHLSFYCCSMEPGETPNPLEGQSYRWVEPDELSNYSFPPADQDFISLLQDESEPLP